jgi:Zn-dependent protease with chaperone function
VDFFAAQERSRRATNWLLFVYGLAMLCIFGAVYLAVSTGFVFYDWYVGVPPEQASSWFSQERALWTMAITFVVIGSSALTKHAALSRGGSEVCEDVGATRVDFSTRRRLERRLLNVVEEMAIAAGTPVPAVYVLEREQAINAFAAGYDLQDAALGVTQGALENLTRDELQALVAHELSHVLNGDMRLNTRLIAALHGILALTIAARLLRHAYLGSKNDDPRNDGWHFSSSDSSSSGSSSSSSGSSDSDSKGGGHVALLLAVLITIVLITIIGAIGAFFARIIQAAVCRQRELLADAQAVQLTRDEDQLRSALRRVEADGVGSVLWTHHASSVAHMFFAEGVRSWLASHPQLSDRIAALGPHGGDKPLPPVENPNGFVVWAPPRLLSVVGKLSRANLDYAAEMLGSLPVDVREALEDPAAGQALVYVLLLHQDHPARQAQWRDLASAVEPEVLARVGKLSDSLRGSQLQQRLPLLELALPTLRGLGGRERRRFLTHVDRLIASDDKTELFELVVQCVVHARLCEPQGAPRRGSKASERRRAARVVLTLLARLQQGDEKLQAKLLFESSFDAGYDPPLEPDDEAATDPDAVRAALELLRHARPKSQRRFLTACESLMLADGALDLEECELFRAIVIGIGVPMPMRPSSSAVNVA